MRKKIFHNGEYKKRPCWFCEKAINNGRATSISEKMSPLHPDCKKDIIHKLTDIYEEQVNWEKKLNEKQKKVAEVLKQGEMTLEELEKQTKIRYSELYSILMNSNLTKRVKRRVDVNKSVYTLKNDYEALQSL